MADNEVRTNPDVSANKQSRKKLVIIVLAVITVAIVGFFVWTKYFGQRKEGFESKSVKHGNENKDPLWLKKEIERLRNKQEELFNGLHSSS